MTVTPASFVSDFPEFTNVPVPGIQFWLDVAAAFLNPQRWPTNIYGTSKRCLLDLGTELFVAHHIAIEQDAQKTAQFNGTPGRVRGPLSSESGGAISTGYDTAAVTYKDAGFWNLTNFGTRFWDLAMLVGSGPIQINIGPIPPFTPGGAGAFVGPYGGWLFGQSW